MKDFIKRRFPEILLTCAIILFIWALVGCMKAERERQETQQQRREYQETGTQAGMPYTKQGTETVVTETVEHEVKKTGLDPEAVEQITSIVTKAIASQVVPKLPGTVSGSHQLDMLVEFLMAYFGGKGLLAGASKLRRKKEPSNG